MSLNSAQEVRLHVDARIKQLRIDVFERPPSTWESFQRMLGSYHALNELKNELEPKRNPEDER